MCEGMVLKNMKANLKGEVFGGVSEFELLVQSYFFELGFRNKDCSTCFLFPSEGARGHCHRCPMYRLPIVGNMSFFYVEPKNGCWLD